jgi:hypothetical protein
MATPIHLSLWIGLVVDAVVRDLQVSLENVGPVRVDVLVKAMPPVRSRRSLKAYESRSDSKCTQSGK